MIEHFEWYLFRNPNMDHVLKVQVISRQIVYEAKPEPRFFYMCREAKTSSMVIALEDELREKLG